MEGWRFSEAKTRCRKFDLKDLLVQGRLAAACRIGSSESEVIPIPHSAWGALTVADESPDLLHHENGAVCQDLRIFPVVHSPNAADLLHDRSLADAFMEFVVRDPEVTVLGELVVAQHGHREVFTDGMAPGPIIDYHWSIGKNAGELASDFVRRIAYFLDDPIPRPSAVITAVAEVLTHRITALRGLLASRQLTALGTHRNTGILGTIHRTQWLRTNQAIDVQNGDLCEYQNRTYIPLWTGILLERSEANNLTKHATTFDKALAQLSGRTSTRSTVKAETQCKSWLAQLMRDHPEGRPQPKAELFREAEEKWSVSGRAFDRAWAAAIEEVDAIAWRSGGRPRKTPAPKTPAPK